jgi:hypothetical protein
LVIVLASIATASAAAQIKFLFAEWAILYGVCRAWQVRIMKDGITSQPYIWIMLATATEPVFITIENATFLVALCQYSGGVTNSQAQDDKCGTSPNDVLKHGTVLL